MFYYHFAWLFIEIRTTIRSKPSIWDTYMGKRYIMDTRFC